jgi:catechol 2,3-dioxygenase-like lactoylglutathione lyase family enzyme
MKRDITAMVDQFAAGRLSRRDLVCALAALVAAAATGGPEVTSAQQPPSTFHALGLNHLALRVTDLDRSQMFYEQHLGMTLIPSRDRSSLRLMACGPHVLNLFKAAQPQMDHFCFTIPDYDPRTAVERLEAKGLKPDVEGDRTHFFDPDGYKLQVGGPNAGGQQATAR